MHLQKLYPDDYQLMKHMIMIYKMELTQQMQQFLMTLNHCNQDEFLPSLGIMVDFQTSL